MPISFAEALSLPESRVDLLKKVKGKIIAGSIDQFRQLSSHHLIKTGKFAHVGSRKIVRGGSRSKSDRGSSCVAP